MLIGNLIENQFITVGEWNFGSAISLIMAMIIMLSMYLTRRMDKDIVAGSARRQQMVGSKNRVVLSVTLIALILVFFYAPIASLMVFSFNNSRSLTSWAGFSTQWYTALFENREMMQAIWVTVIVALSDHRDLHRGWDLNGHRHFQKPSPDPRTHHQRQQLPDSQS
jgi:ABC-type spermidine/putrescine transport system permease subunit I